MGTIITETTKKTTEVEGCFLQPLNIIETPNGCVLHMLRHEYGLMPDLSAGFGELYFSEILAQKIKAWKRHKKQQQLFAVPWGLIKIVLFDAREKSSSYGIVMELLLGRPKHYNLLSIPPGIWYGFKAVDQSSLLCNFANLPHDPKECERLPFDSEQIPYKW